MPAVRKPAFAEELFNIRKRLTQPRGHVPAHSELAHTGRVNYHHAVFEHNQLTVRCGVPSAAVVLTNPVDRHDFLPRKGVYKA